MHIRREDTANGALLHIKFDNVQYPIPPRQMFADYADVRVERDAVHLLFGKMDSFRPEEAPLSYALEISFPYSQFVRQLYRSIVEPPAPGVMPFREVINEGQRVRGYPVIETMHRASSAVKQGTARANSAAMYMYDDEACIDFFHVDAFSLHVATQGAQNLNIEAVVRVTTSPNVLAYFVQAVIRAAEEVMRRVPSLAQREEAADA